MHRLKNKIHHYKAKIKSSKKAIKAFTLIELLMVIAIIALLSSAVIAAVIKGREAAKDTQVASTTTKLRNALDQYMSDNGGQPPCAIPDGSYNGWSIDDRDPLWDSQFMPKLKDYIQSYPNRRYGGIKYECKSFFTGSNKLSYWRAGIGCFGLRFPGYMIRTQIINPAVVKPFQSMAPADYWGVFFTDAYYSDQGRSIMTFANGKEAYFVPVGPNCDSASSTPPF